MCLTLMLKSLINSLTLCAKVQLHVSFGSNTEVRQSLQFLQMIIIKFYRRFQQHDGTIIVLKEKKNSIIRTSPGDINGLI